MPKVILKLVSLGRGFANSLMYNLTSRRPTGTFHHGEWVDPRCDLKSVDRTRIRWIEVNRNV